MLLAILSEVVNQASQPESKDLVEILQLLVLPVVLASLPIIMKRNKRVSSTANTVAENVGQTNGHGTLAHMAEQTLIAVGGLKSDIAHLDAKVDGHDSRLERIEHALGD